MRKAFSYSLLPAILLGLVLLSAFVLQSKDTDQEVFARIHKEEQHNHTGAAALQEAINRIGHRLTGSANGKKAEQYAYDLFKKYGYKNVKFDGFEVEAWSRESVKLDLYYQGSDTLHALPDGNPTFPIKLNTGNASCVTMPEVVSLAQTPLKSDVFAPVLDIGNGLKADFEKHKDSVKGKIVLLNLGIYPRDSTLKNLHRSEKTALAIQYGARGCIFINNVEGRILLTGTASVDGKIIPIPAVCITQEDGFSFRECGKLSGHPWARIRMSNKSGKIQARNVVATIKGTELPDEEIILCGHLDSWDLASGAIDNGIGSFSVLEIARVFEKLQIHPRRTIRFITFMGEEQGLLGSKAYVKERKNAGTLDKIKYVINLDMAGNTSGFNSSGRPEMETFTKAVIEEIKKADPEFKGSYGSSAGLHSDHQTFLEQGIPIMEPEGSLDRSVYKYYHSNKDDFALVNPEHMSRCAEYVGMMVYALANAKDLPAHRLNDSETRDFFIKAHLKDELILGGEWRWDK
ncbi:MAG TPA: M28 family peptidase [Bacteroidia bacterium]|jgi:hypothetical protein|nr:M28 family peptidase [Bacteroidia bacterium]